MFEIKHKSKYTKVNWQKSTKFHVDLTLKRCPVKFGVKYV